MSIICIGAINVDEILTLRAPPQAGTSNPGTRAVARGGVARNVAENLARLDVPTTLVGVVGDHDGHDVLAETAQARVGLRADVLPGRTTGRYTAVLAPGGALVIGIAAMDIHDAMTPEWLAGKTGLIDRADWVFADANLPATSLAWLAGRGRRLALNTVSVAKAPRLPGHVDTLFCNLGEAAALAGGDGDAASLARQLTARAGRVVVTDGAAGLAWAEGSDGGMLPALTAARIDETGAGDALIAGTLYGLRRGTRLADACRLGLAAAALTLGVVGPCAELSPARLHACAA